MIFKPCGAHTARGRARKQGWKERRESFCVRFCACTYDGYRLSVSDCEFHPQRRMSSAACLIGKREMWHAKALAHPVLRVRPTAICIKEAHRNSRREEHAPPSPSTTSRRDNGLPIPTPSRPKPPLSQRPPPFLQPSGPGGVGRLHPLC